MPNSFDPKLQETDLVSKIVVGVERLSEVFRVLLWEKSKETGLSPIQIQLLLFIKDHPSSLANVSSLSREFNLKKPTISDAVKVLFRKEYVSKEGEEDARSYTLRLTPAGHALANQLEDFDIPLRETIQRLDKQSQEGLFDSLVKVIYSLNDTGLIQVQRTCFGCRFYDKTKAGHYCQFIKSKLSNDELRVDCSDYQPIA